MDAPTPNPHFDGAACFEAMKQVRERHSIPGVAMSGDGMEEDFSKSREAGFAGHLVKPISMSKLQDAIRHIIARK